MAVLKVDATGLPTVELANPAGSGASGCSLWVIPGASKGAATAGVVMGVGSDWPELPQPGHGRTSEVSANQASGEWLVASLHLRPGHSGGPIVDAHGRLVGINTMMAGPGVGVAVPVHVVKRFLQQTLKR